ncbi:ArsC family reductase [Neisseriaceae bacterium B1]
MIELYGIPNCTTVKKARVWLEENGIAYEFHDFKKAVPSSEWLSGCLKSVPLETLLNKRGTTWRKLTPEQQAKANDEADAIELMRENPSVIKRPVLDLGDKVYVGFNEAMYKKIFQAA